MTWVLVRDVLGFSTGRATMCTWAGSWKSGNYLFHAFVCLKNLLRATTMNTHLSKEEPHFHMFQRIWKLVRLFVFIGTSPRARLLMTVTMCALICVWSGNRCCCAVNFFLMSVGHMERSFASRISLGSWTTVRSRCLFSKFPQAWRTCERSPMLVTLGGDKLCLLSSKLRPAANGSYRAASHRHCSRAVSQSSPRITSKASPSIL